MGLNCRHKGNEIDLIRQYNTGYQGGDDLLTDRKIADPQKHISVTELSFQRGGILDSTGLGAGQYYAFKWTATL